MDSMEHLRARLEALEHHVKRLEVHGRSVEQGPRNRGLDQRRSRSQRAGGVRLGGRLVFCGPIGPCGPSIAKQIPHARAWEALPGAFGHYWQISVLGHTSTKCFCGPRIVSWCAYLRERRSARREIPSPKPAPRIL
jgi:hypothetical protein